MAYVDDLHQKTLERLKAASPDRLLEDVEFYGYRWPVYGRVSFGHAFRHIGMIEDLRGLIRGPGKGTASI